MPKYIRLKKNPEKKRGVSGVPGSTLILVLVALTFMMLEVAIVSLVLIRSLGDEGMLTSQNLSARQGLDSAFTRITSDLNASLSQGMSASVAATAYASGGTNDIDAVTLTTTNPEGGATDNTATVISAWVQSRRGNYFQIRARAVTGQVSLAADRWVLINPCSASGSLTTIVSGRPYPGYEAAGVDTTTGRVYFGENNNPGNLYTWDATSGLMTIVSGLRNPGAGSLKVDSENNRAYFTQACGYGPIYTWSPSTNLTTYAWIDCMGDGEGVALGKNRYFSGAFSQAFTWSPDGGGQVIYSPAWWVGTGRAMAVHKATNRVFMGGDMGRIVTWQASTGLTTIQTTAKGWGSLIVDQNTGRAFFGEHGGSRMFTWHPGTGLTTIAWTGWFPGSRARAVNERTGAFFYADTPEGTGNVYTWSASTGLTTLATSVNGVDDDSMVVDELTGRVFWGHEGTGGLYTWLSGSGLTTLGSGIVRPGDSTLAIDRTTGRVFFGEYSGSGRFYTWHSSTGLSIILSGAVYPGYDHSVAVDEASGRVYFGEYGATGRLYTWSASTGLSTIVFDRPYPGRESLAIDPTSGRVFFGEYSATGNFYAWTPPGISGVPREARLIGKAFIARC